MKIKLVDSAFAHTPTGQICDFYKSDKLEWDRSNADGLLAATDYSLFDIGDRDPRNIIALLLEPRELLPGIYNFIQSQGHHYKYVLTHDADLLKLPNALAYQYGGCWIEPKDVAVHGKTKNISIIASDKKITTGHKLRHNIIGRLGDKMDVYGRGYNPVEKKIEALADYRYSIVIENVAQDNFFTEKLIDCFATGTIPIYWGMPSIGKFFNKKGIITFTSVAELTRKLTLLENNWEKEYDYRKDAIAENFSTCQQYFATEDSIYKALTGKV
jgi:hypothetical protein